ncbi:MAG: hypothetical protein NT007_19330 [Candidatus Kapabacteria bacterium]|nr:hypothetical protein [Candidatus Kapabacteria bacterium]
MKISYFFIKYILIILSFIAVFSCSDYPTSLNVPQWKTDINLPLTKRNFSLQQLIKPDKYIRIDSTDKGNLKYRIQTDTLKRVQSVEEFIKGHLDGSFTNIKLVMSNAQGQAGVDLLSGVKLDSAYLTGGQFSLTIFNTSTTTMNYTVELPAFQQLNGTVFSVSGTIPAGQSFTKNESLAGYAYSTFNQSDKSKLLINGKVSTGSPISSFTVSLVISGTRFNYISGVIPPKQLSPIVAGIGLPMNADVKKFQNLLIPFDCNLQINGLYITQFPEPFEVLLKNVHVTGRRNDGASQPLTDNNGKSNLDTMLIRNGKFNRLFTATNSNVCQLISFMPDSLFINADVVMNPNTKHGIASMSDSISVKCLFTAGAILTLKTINLSDTSKLDISESDRSKIRDADSIIMTFDITNGIPLQAGLYIKFTDNNLKEFFHKEVNVPGAHTRADGNGANPIENKVVIKLSSTEIVQFSKCNNILIDIKTATSDEQRAVLTPDEFLNLIGYFEIFYKMKTN